MKIKNQSHFLYGIIICLLIGIVHYRSSLQNMWSYFAYSYLSGYSSCRSFLKDCSTYVVSQKNLINSVDAIKNRYEKLFAAHVALLHALSRRNDDILVSKETNIYNFHTCHAKILMKKCSPYEQRIIIDRGSIHGVIPDMPVVHKTFLIGKIHRVYAWYSEVILINDRVSRVPIVFSGTRVKGITEGINSNTELRALFVEDTPELAIGNYAFTSGEGLVYQAGFCVGKIREIIRSGGVYSTVILDFLVDIKSLDHCHVVFNEYSEKSNEQCLSYCINLWNDVSQKNIAYKADDKEDHRALPPKDHEIHETDASTSPQNKKHNAHIHNKHSQELHNHIKNPKKDRFFEKNEPQKHSHQQQPKTAKQKLHDETHTKENALEDSYVKKIVEPVSAEQLDHAMELISHQHNQSLPLYEEAQYVQANELPKIYAKNKVDQRVDEEDHEMLDELEQFEEAHREDQ